MFPAPIYSSTLHPNDAARHEGLKQLQALQDREKGAPLLAECTPIQDVLAVLQQIQKLNQPLRSYDLLIRAARAGFAELVASLIKCKVNVNTCDINGETPFIAAVTNGRLTIIKMLYLAGADPRSHVPGRSTVLNFAIEEESVTQVKIWIGAGVDVNTRHVEMGGITPLMHAIASRQFDAVEVVSALLEGKANTRACDEFGDTALMHACRSKLERRYELISLLCAHESNLLAKNHAGWMAEHIAVKYQDKKMRGILVAATLVQHIKTGNWPEILRYVQALPRILYSRDFYKKTPLMHAAIQGNIAMVRLFMAAGADPTVVDAANHTAMDYAAKANRLDLVKVMMQGKEYVVAHKQEWEPDLLRMITSAQSPQVTQISQPTLVSQTVSQNRKEHRPLNAFLHKLPRVCLMEVAKYLTLSELNALDLVDKKYALKTHSIWLVRVKMLCKLEIGAPDLSPNPEDAKGVYQEIWKVKHSLKNANYIDSVVSQGCEKLTSALVNAGVSVNRCNQMWQTPLMRIPAPLVKAGSPPKTVCHLTSILIAAGADVNARDKAGQTPLIYAAGIGNLAGVKTLLEARADIAVFNQQALDTLRNRGYLQVASFIVEYMAMNQSQEQSATSSTIRQGRRLRGEDPDSEQKEKRARKKD